MRAIVLEGGKRAAASVTKQDREQRHLLLGLQVKSLVRRVYGDEHSLLAAIKATSSNEPTENYSDIIQHATLASTDK